MAVQQEIAWQISEALRLKLTGRQKKKLRKRPTVDPEAYQEYLRGRYSLATTGRPDGFRRALEHFERAIARDPTYALAYAGLGDAFGAHGLLRVHPPEDGFPRAQAAAERAIELDPEVADAHVTLALEQAVLGRTGRTRGSSSSRRSIALNPKLASCAPSPRSCSPRIGRFDEAIGEARTAPRAGSAVAPHQHERRLGTVFRRPARRSDRRAAATRDLHAARTPTNRTTS